MTIGVDFDNTIVCYDGIFHRVALERGWIPAEVGTDKSSVKDYLCHRDQEALWTELQGIVYGPALSLAKPYPGVIEFFREANHLGIDTRIISHKTALPFLGESHDLHQAAWDWLEGQGFFNPDLVGMRRDHVFFELTKEAKLQRIRLQGCTHFIDDLAEFLNHPDFPPGVERILFAPCSPPRKDTARNTARSWAQITTALLPTTIK